MGESIEFKLVLELLLYYFLLVNKITAASCDNDICVSSTEICTAEAVAMSPITGQHLRVLPFHVNKIISYINL